MTPTSWEPWRGSLWAATLIKVYGGNPSRGSAADALAMMRQCREIAVELAEPAFLARATYLFGFAQLRGEDLAQGFFMLAEGIELERSCGTSNPHLGFAQFLLVIVATLGNLVDMAHTVGEECRAVCRAVGDEWLQSWIVLFLGMSEVLQDLRPRRRKLA